jgi:hypothetical protein
MAVAAAVVGAGLTLIAGGGPLEAQSNPNDTYYRCESGWTFETGTNAARCKRGGGLIRRSMLACPQATLPTGHKVGTAFRQNYNGQKDMCVTEIPGAALVALEIPCPPAFNKAVQAGRDDCVQPNPIQVKPPSVAVEQ